MRTAKPAITAKITNNGFQISTSTMTIMNNTAKMAAVTPNRMRAPARNVILTCSQRAAKFPLARAYSRTPRASTPTKITAIQMAASFNKSFACPQA